MTLQRDHSGRFYHDDDAFDLDTANAVANMHATIGYCAVPNMIRYFYEHSPNVFNEYMETYLVKFWSDPSH